MAASRSAYPSALVALATLSLRTAEPPEGWQKKNTASLAVLVMYLAHNWPAFALTICPPLL
eukprot:689943-Pyramimonas_sp.AAC.1